METCCWTRTIADGDRESRRGKRLAVLYRAVLCCGAQVLVSTGCLTQQPCMANLFRRFAQAPETVPHQLCYQTLPAMCWTEPLAVDELLTKLLPARYSLLYWSPTKRESWTVTVHAIRIQTALNSSSHSRKSCFYHTHCLLCSTHPLLVILCVLLTAHHNMLPSSSSLPPKLFSLL